MTNRRFIVPLLVLGVLASSVLLGQGQSTDPIAKEHRGEVLYDQGVHAFFDRDYQDAIQRLGQVESLGSADPRPYFFLGLAYLKDGDRTKAGEYLQKAAQLEWTGRGARDYSVSTALIRIQGEERLLLESYRKQAKREWQKTEAERQKVRYGQTKEEEKAVLAAMREQGPKLPPPPTEPFVGTAPFGARSTDPFRTPEDDGEQRLVPADDKPPQVEKPESVEEKTPDEPMSEEKPAEPKKADEDDPFADEPMSEEKPTEPKKADENDPFADEPMSEEKPAEPKKADEDDPFADEPMSEEKPAEPKKADEDDPFADEPMSEEKPAEQKPADKKEEKKDEDIEIDPFA